MIQESLNQLQIAVCDELYRRIVSEKASSSDIANAIRFLKDNGVIINISKKQDELEVTQELPSDEEINSLLDEAI